MPRILFDARPLGEHSGVSRVAARVLAYIHATRPDAGITTITTGWKKTNASIHLRLPNKLWSLFCLLGLVSLDRAAAWKAGAFDELILPNVGFVGTPRVPYTVVVHDLSFLIEPRWFSLKMRAWHHAVRARRLIRQAAHVWCVSQTTAEDVKRLLDVPTERVTVLPADVVYGKQEPFGGAAELRLASLVVKQSSHPQKALTSRTQHPFILAFAGSVRKNIGTAIAAVERVRQDKRYRDLRLVIVGEIPARRALFGSHQILPDWIIVFPRVSDNELQGLYTNASALLYPSWYEGFGLPLHEAAAFGIPLLASAHGALPETAPPGTILIPPAKPHLWATMLKDVLTQ
ncbi:MAG: hypothetical protein RL141_429 [Candidatus Parcubacteria bacterium]|jgi:glycosyltransferase involved in cell wall biosynthesis